MAEKTKKKVVVKKTQPKASRASASKTVAKKAVVKKAVKKVASKTSATVKKVAAKKSIKNKVASKAPATKKTAKKAVAKKPLKNAASKASKSSASRTVVKKAAPKKSTNKRSSKKTKKDEECFLTTACVNYYALSDDAYELTTLRSFRDQYMRKSTKGRTLVNQYYAVAPLIVSLINKDKEHKSVYQYIYRSIQKACSEIELKKYRIAQQTYVALVNTLVKKYTVA